MERKWWQGDPNPAGAFVDRHPILGWVLIIISITFALSLVGIAYAGLARLEQKQAIYEKTGHVPIGTSR